MKDKYDRFTMELDIGMVQDNLVHISSSVGGDQNEINETIPASPPICEAEEQTQTLLE